MRCAALVEGRTLCRCARAFGTPRCLRSEILPYASASQLFVRFFPRFHCFQAGSGAAPDPRVLFSRTEGVSQNPKYPITLAVSIQVFDRLFQVASRPPRSVPEPP